MFIYVNHDDKRALELSELLLEKGYYVSNDLKDMKYADVIYLGRKGIDRKHRLTTLKDTVIVDENDLKKLKEHCLVLTLSHNQYLKELSIQYHFDYQFLLGDEQFVSENSMITAEGVIAYIITHRLYPIYQSHVLILGYGHCAQPLVDHFIDLKAKVSVAVRRKELKDEIERKGASYYSIEQIDLSDVDIVVNTIPSLVIDEKCLNNARRHILLIDIASYPYGIDHHYALTHGLNCQILSSVPCLYAYGYAGKIIVDYIERKLSDA